MICGRFLWTHCSWTLQNARRDAAKLQQIIEAKEIENNVKARHIEDTQRLVSEIEMLRVVLVLQHMKEKRKS